MLQKLMKQAKLHYNNGEYEKAAECYKKCYDEAGSPVCLLMAGEAYSNIGKYGLALKYYRLYHGESDSSESYKYIAKALFSLGRYNEASDNFSLYYAESNAAEKIGIGDMFFQADEFEEAAYWYSEAHRAAASDAVLLKLAGTYFYGGRYDLGSEICKKLQSKGSDDMKFRIAEMYYDTGNFESGLEIYRQMEQEGNFDAKKKLAATLYRLERYVEAIDIYRECLDTENTGEIKYWLGECYYRVFGEDNTFENAVYWFSYAAEEGCNKGLYKMGLCYQYGKGVEIDLNKAVECYLKACNCGVAAAICKVGQPL